MSKGVPRFQLKTSFIAQVMEDLMEELEDDLQTWLAGNSRRITWDGQDVNDLNLSLKRCLMRRLVEIIKEKLK
jgi:hypothetical protein